MAIVTKQRINVVESEKFESNQFSIQASSEAFRILSDGLYSDKIKAVIRELSTNAVDSVIAAGTKDKGYDLHLPCTINPFFYIRDYGTGLGHDEVMELYTTYFYSDKTDSNDYVGQLGLGSKSPFAYTDNFSITSYKDGIQRSYTACINEDGYPTIKFLDSYDTDEPNGLKVQFAVHSYDCNEFRDKAEQVYKWFDPCLCPCVLNCLSWSYSDIEYRMGIEGDWLVLDDHHAEPVAVMGNIAYPIKNLKDQGGLKPIHRSLLNVGAVLYFGIGELQITPSREALSLNRSTVRKLIEKIDHVTNSISENVNKEFEQCESLWGARVLAKNLFGSWDSPLYHLNGVCKWSEIKWNGSVIHYERASIKDINGVSIDLFTNNKSSGYGDLANARRESVQTIPVMDKIHIFENDLERGSQARCKNFTEQNNINCFLAKFDSEEAKQNFMEHVGFLDSDIKYVSSLPKPIRSISSRSSSGIRKDKVFKLDTVYKSNNKSENWDSSVIEFDNDSGIYVKINRYNVIHNGEKHCPTSLSNVVQKFMKTVNKDDLPEDYLDEDGRLKVYGVKERSSKIYDNSDRWVDAIEFMENYLKNNHSEDIKIVNLSYMSSSLLMGIDNELCFIKQGSEYLSERYSTIINTLKEASLKIEKNDLESLRIFLDSPLIDVKIDFSHSLPSFEQIEEHEKRVLDKYPMIKVYLSLDHWDRTSGHRINAQNYIDFVNSVR